MASVTLKKINKTYEGATQSTVRDIDLEIHDKEFVVLVGPSGCGKSTTLRMIAGLEDITAGEMYIGENLVNTLPPKDRDIAMVFQNYALYPHMNVYDNMSFGLKLRNFAKTEIDKRVKEAARILGLETYLDRLPKQLSGGQRQRVALGRAIVREPKVFLMDEPLSNLDAKLRVQMRAEIKKLHQRLQTTFVYVTHDQVEAMTMADRIVILHNGIIQQNDTPAVIYARPANVFVAGFIGSPPMNFMTVNITSQGLELPAKTDSGKHMLPVNLKEEFIGISAGDSKAVLGVRPEHIIVDPSKEKDVPCVNVPCTVDLLEPMGSETYLYLVHNGHNLVARTSPTFEARVGQQVTARFPIHQLHLFRDGDTTRVPRPHDGRAN